MKIIMIISILILSLSANWKTARENLEKVYLIDDFRIFYSLVGVNAIKDRTDYNKNNIPDFIENLGLQFKAANEIFHNQLHFIKPLNNSVYRGRANHIDIHVLSLKKGNNGTAGDAVIGYNYKAILSNGKSVSMAISNKLKTGNLTPMHELFHIYQNGYSMIKNSWYTEGTARWSQMIFEQGFGKTALLPKSKKELKKILSKTYAAKYFWNRVAYLCSSKKRFNTEKYKNLYYIGLDKKVVTGNDIHGFEFMRDFLKNLDLEDDIISKTRNFQKYKWKEKYQKDKFNNIFILDAIVKAIQKSKYKNNRNNELNNFIKLVK